MCGFYSVFSTAQRLKVSDRNHTSLLHRGPDSQGELATDHFYTKHYRLEIIGGKSASQPMRSRSGRFWVVFNGEIYNYKELASDLLNPGLVLEGDTRVLVEFLDKFGMLRLNSLNGMFAFLIYDCLENQFHLVRDRYGVKPLYYSERDGKVFVCSEIKGLFPNIPAEIELGAVEDYLEYAIYPQGERTFFKNVLQCEPGTLISFTKEGKTVERYYDLAKNLQARTDRSTLNEFENLFEDSIRIRLRSDIPISLHYSGGVDSTALLLKTKEVWGWDYPLHTFTIAYPDRDVDESSIAEHYCQRLNISNDKMFLRAHEVPDLTEKLQWYCDEPFGGLPSVAHYKFNLFQKERGFTVALEGQGGDEALGGYRAHVYLGAYDLLLTNKNPKLLEELLNYIGESRNSLVRTAEKLIEIGFGAHSDLTDFRERKERVDKALDSWLISIQLYDTLKNKIPRLLRFEDRTAMAASREIRFPFLDFRVMEAAFSLSHEEKLDGGIPKSPLVRLIRKYLGQEFQAPKRSIVSSQTHWLMGALKEWVWQNLRDFEKRNFIDIHHFRKAYSQLEQKDLANSFFLWQMVNLNQMFNNLKRHYV